MRSITDSIKAVLDDGDWLGPDVPFGATPVVFQTVRPVESELKALTGNVVAVTFGNQSDDGDLELGGGEVQTEYVLFVDVWAEEQAVAIAIASDIRDHFTGKPNGGTRFVRVRDYTTEQDGEVIPGWLAEYTDVVREPVERELVRVNWQVVKATALLIYPGSE